MTNYLISQAINITVLVAFALVLVLRARGDFRRRLRTLQSPAPFEAPSAEKRKLELRSKIGVLQRELSALEEAVNSASALRAN